MTVSIETLPDYAAAAAELLGGEAVLGVRVETRAQLEALAERGLPRRSAYAIADAMGDDVLLALLLPLSHQSISMQSKGVGSGYRPGVDAEFARPDVLLNHGNTSAIVEGALVLAHAVEVFGRTDLVRAWLDDSIPALKDRRPIDLLKLGKLREVDDAIGRLEHGVFA